MQSFIQNKHLFFNDLRGKSAPLFWRWQNYGGSGSKTQLQRLTLLSHPTICR
jgi:hypothetical protein